MQPLQTYIYTHGHGHGHGHGVFILATHPKGNIHTYIHTYTHLTVRSSSITAQCSHYKRIYTQHTYIHTHTHTYTHFTVRSSSNRQHHRTVHVPNAHVPQQLLQPRLVRVRIMRVRSGLLWTRLQRAHASDPGRQALHRLRIFHKMVVLRILHRQRHDIMVDVFQRNG